MSSFTFNSRRYVITVLLCVALLSISFLTATELLIRARVIPNDRLSWHRDQFFRGDSQNVVFGDSHTSLGVHGLSGFLNLSFPSENVPLIEIKVRRYFANKQPGKVILQATPHMFSPDRDNQDERNEARPFITNKWKPYLWMFTRAHYQNIYTYWKLFLSGASFENKYNFQPDGALTQEGDWRETSLSQRRFLTERRIDQQKPYAEPAEIRSVQSYARILGFLKSRGAEVCMVDMPVTPLYRELSANYEEFESARVLLRSLAADYEARYTDMSAAITDLEYFLNQDHLNERGSLKFAPLLESACFG